MEKSETAYSFPDRHQNFWQLASIQSAATGIPVIMIGGQLAVHYGTGVAITSVILGNLILWMVGIAIVSMAAPGRVNALENVSRYLGKLGGIAAAFFLILSFLSWYILQLNAANAALTHLLLHQETQLQLGAGLGAFIALLSIGGIQLIKKYCVAILPLFLVFVIYSMIVTIPHFRIDSIWEFSFLGIIAIISTTLPGIVNLPTFFRHSRSRYDSYLGLSLMIAFTMLFQIYAVISGFHDITSIVAENFTYAILLSAFILLSLISINLVNIYFASAGWEMIFPHRKSNKEFVIVGLLGTAAYTFLQVSAPMQFFLSMAENFIASLGVVLLMSFLIKTFAQHRPRPYEKLINMSCWFFGALLGTILSAQDHIGPSHALIISFSATSIAFLCVIYIEETYWSVKKVITTRKP